jgi:hypothetical protein
VELLKENFDLNDLLGWGFVHSELTELGLEIPDFKPNAMEDQGSLDMKNPVVCPACGHEFHPEG